MASNSRPKRQRRQPARYGDFEGEEVSLDSRCNARAE